MVSTANNSLTITNDNAFDEMICRCLFYAFHLKRQLKRNQQIFFSVGRYEIIPLTSVLYGGINYVELGLLRLFLA